MKVIEKILVPTDFSEMSLAGMDYAESLSQAYNAAIIVTHVIEIPSRFRFPKSEEESAMSLEAERNRAGKEMNEFLQSRFALAATGVRSIIRAGDPAREIVALAEEEDVDLIIMATHGRTGFIQTLLGSVAESVVRRSGVPVMTVKPDYVRERMLESGDVEEQLHMRPRRLPDMDMRLSQFID